MPPKKTPSAPRISTRIESQSVLHDTRSKRVCGQNNKRTKNEIKVGAVSLSSTKSKTQVLPPSSDQKFTSCKITSKPVRSTRAAANPKTKSNVSEDKKRKQVDSSIAPLAKVSKNIASGSASRKKHAEIISDRRPTKIVKKDDRMKTKMINSTEILTLTVPPSNYRKDKNDPNLAIPSVKLLHQATYKDYNKKQTKPKNSSVLNGDCKTVNEKEIKRQLILTDSSMKDNNEQKLKTLKNVEKSSLVHKTTQFANKGTIQHRTYSNTLNQHLNTLTTVEDQVYDDTGTSDYEGSTFSNWKPATAGLIEENMIEETLTPLNISNEPNIIAKTSKIEYLQTTPVAHSTSTPVDHSTSTPAAHSTSTPVDHSTSTPVAHSTSTSKSMSERAAAENIAQCVRIVHVAPSDNTRIVVKTSSEQPPKNCTEGDKVFDNVSALVKDSVLSIPGMRFFILHKLPAVTGVLASQTGPKVALSGNLLSLLSSWTLLEKMTKLFVNLKTGSDYCNTDHRSSPVIDHEKYSKQNLTSLSRLTSLLQNLDPETSSPLLDSDCTTLPEYIHLIAQSIQNEKTEKLVPDSNESIVVKCEFNDVEEGQEESSNTKESTTDTTISEKDSYICNICCRDCYSEVSLACHMAVTHATETNSCVVCNNPFPSQTELLMHISQTHEKNKIDQPSFKCYICPKTFVKQRYLKTHLKRHAGIKNHECPICHWKFFERTKLKWHMETHKEADQRNLPYKCNVCMKRFYNRPAWSDHMNIHSGQKPFKCTVCSASFGHRMGLKRHELVHQRECNFNCEYCGKGFKLNSKLKEHIVLHTGIGNNKCQTCGKVYTTNSSLKRHNCLPVDAVVVCQQMQEEPYDAPQYMCSECNALFATLEDAEIHSFTHTPQPCDGYEIELSNGSSRFVYVKQDGVDIEMPSDANMALIAVDGGYMTCNEDISTISNNDEQIVASTLADLSTINV